VNREASLLPPYVSTRASARWVTGLLVASGAVAWIAVGIDLAELRLLSRLVEGHAVELPEREAFALTREVVRVLQLSLILATVGLFIAWLYRSRVNVRAFGARRLQWARNWSVLAFLIPVANLLLPYAVIREVWQASDPRATDPLEWKLVRPGRLLRLWWGAVVACLCVAAVASFMTDSAGLSPSRLQLARGITLLGDVGVALAASLGYFVVAHISEAQDEKWERLAGAGGTG